MAARLFVIPGSHPSLSARLMLERKRIPYRRVDLLPVLAKPLLRALRFQGATVPALTIAGRRVQGSRAIARELEGIRPDPPLLPQDREQRAAVEEAERFGDEVLQPIARRLVWWALRRDPAPLASFAEGARLGVPVGLAVRTARPIVWAAARMNSADDATVRADLEQLPAILARVDALIGEGVIGAAEPNAADYQIATSLRLLLCLEDVAPAIERRPVGELALRVAPNLPGNVGPTFPRPWLAPLSAPAELAGT